MKTAEEYFNNGFGEDVEKVHRNHVIALMENYANEVSKALLEEAAEKIQETRKIKFPSLVFEAYNNGIDDSKAVVLSLIPKDI